MRSELELAAALLAEKLRVAEATTGNGELRLSWRRLNTDLGVYSEPMLIEIARRLPRGVMLRLMEHGQDGAVVYREPGSDREAVVRVFGHWREVAGRSRATLTTKRYRAVSARLREGWTPEELCRAIDGWRLSEWHQGQNPQGVVYDALEMMLGKEERVTRFVRLADSDGRGPGDKTADEAMEDLYR